jgi:hypothetical protein
MFVKSFLYQRPFWGGRGQRHGELTGNPFTITFATSLEVPGGKQLRHTELSCWSTTGDHEGDNW